MSSTHPAPQPNNDNHNNDEKDDDDFLSKLNPLNQLSAFLPKGASDLFGIAGAATGAEAAKDNTPNQKPTSGLICPLSGNQNAVSDEVDRMLFDAVPFNGDTDRGASSMGSPEYIMDMDIDIPMKRMGSHSNLSNISPIGNVSSRVPFDEDDYESDDDLDRILGTMKAGLGKQLYPEVQQQLEEHKKQKTLHNKDALNTTMPTLLSGSSMDSDTEEEAAALGDLVFEQPRDNHNHDHGGDNHTTNHHSVDSVTKATDTTSEIAAKKALAWPMERSIEIRHRFKDPPKKPRFRSRTVWLIGICGVLLVVVGVLLGVTMRGRQDQTTANAAAASSETTTTPPTPVPTNGKQSLLRPSVGQRPRPNLPPELILPADIIETSAPTTSPSQSETTRNPVTIPWSDIVGETNSVNDDQQEAQDEDEGRVSSRLPQVRLDMGPMVGHTTFDSVTLWAYYTKPAIYLFEEDYKLEILLYDSDGWLSTLDEAEVDPDRSNAVFATLTNLEPSRVYRYEMRIMEQVVGSGSFQTAPPPVLLDETANIRFNTNDGGTKFEYLLTSCMDRSEYATQKAWDAISKTEGGAKEYPDFALFAGDTIYLQEGIDVDDWWGVRLERYWFRSERQRTEPHFADFVSNTPIYSVWNNHDYGSSVADMEQPGKEDSLLAWRSLWPNPDYAGVNTNLRNTDGIYYSFYWGDVHFIVTDDHWNRNPFQQNRWGRQQTKWIQDELINSKGVFKIIVLGSDINERDWASDLENIAPTVAEHSINGVLFNAGDIHRNEYKRVRTGGFPYPVTQISSSGIAKVWRQPFAKIAVDTTVSDPFIRVRFFGATSQDAETTTWKNDPNLVCSAVEGEDREKEHSCTETIRLSDLTIGAK